MVWKKSAGYVAITRAKERLFLMDSEGLTAKGDKKLPSRFLFEIGEDNYHRIGEIPKELKSESRSFASRTDFSDESTTEMKVDEMVEHHIFGKGKIIDYDAKRDSYTVKFDNLSSNRSISRSYFSVKHEQKPLSKTVSPMVQPQYTKNCNIEKAKPPKLDLTIEKTDNLWKRDDVPHSGWSCSGVTDLGAPTGICQMCGYQIIRYVHHMHHPLYSPLNVGCVCAGKMEGNIDKAKRREQEFKNRQSRRESFNNKSWKTSKNGNLYLKIKGHLIVLYMVDGGIWRYAVDGRFCDKAYYSKQDVFDAVFEKSEEFK